MANQARIALENALRAKQLDRTLTSVLPPEASAGAAGPGGAWDQLLGGGFPHGQLSEIAGPHSSGRMSVALQAMAGATRRGELAAFVDTFDRLDVASADAAGVALDRLLWIRGQATHAAGLSSRYSGTRPDLGERTLDRALKSLMLVLQAGGFGLVVFDLADLPPAVLRRLPAPTWLRVQRVIEGRDTACVLITPEPLARSAGGLTLSLAARSTWHGTADGSRLMTGLTLEGRVISPRRRVDGGLTVSAHHPWISTHASRQAG